MTTPEDQTRPEGTIEQLEATLARLTVDQIRFLVARTECDTDQEAASKIGVPSARVKQWKYRGAPIDEALRLMAHDGVATALHLRRRHLAKAMAVKVAGLDDTDAKIRQGVATELIEWEMPPTHKTEVSGSVRIEYVIPDENRANQETG